MPYLLTDSEYADFKRMQRAMSQPSQAVGSKPGTYRTKQPNPIRLVTIGEPRQPKTAGYRKLAKIVEMAIDTYTPGGDVKDIDWITIDEIGKEPDQPFPIELIDISEIPSHTIGIHAGFAGDRNVYLIDRRPRWFKIKSSTLLAANRWNYTMRQVRLKENAMGVTNKLSPSSWDFHPDASDVNALNAAEVGNTATSVYGGTTPLDEKLIGIQPLAVDTLVMAAPASFPGGDLWIIIGSGSPNQPDLSCTGGTSNGGTP